MKNNNSLLKMEQERQGRQLPQYLKFIIIVSCILADFITFFILFDSIFNQSEVLNWLTAGICAMALNMFPMLISYILNNRKLTNFERVIVVVFAVAFVVALSICFTIRVNSKEALFSTESFLNRENEENLGVLEEEVLDEEITYTTAQTATAVLMGLMPALTSAICFGLTYENPKRSYIKKLRNQQVVIKDKINHIEANIALLTQELDNHNLGEFDAERYEQAVRTVQLIQQYAQVVSRRVLAQKIGTALATTDLMEENSLKSFISDRLVSNKNC